MPRLNRVALPATALAVLAALTSEAAAGGTAYDIAPLLNQPYPFASGAAAAPTPAPAQTPATALAPGKTAAPRTLSPFNASRDRWYVDGAIGLVVPRDMDNRGAIDITAYVDNAALFAGSVGYAWRNGFRVEGQVLYEQMPINQVQIKNAGNIARASTGTAAAEGDATALFLLANVAYDFETAGPWSPYVIGGFGAAQIGFNDVKSQGVPLFDDASWVLGFGFGLGVSYIFTDHWTGDVGYRMLFTLQPTLTDSAGDSFTSEFLTHNFLFNVRYAF